MKQKTYASDWVLNNLYKYLNEGRTVVHPKRIYEEANCELPIQRGVATESERMLRRKYLKWALKVLP